MVKALVIVIACGLPASSLFASDLAAAPSAEAGAAPAALSFAGPSFLFARYATRGASSLYAARGLGHASVVFGMVENSRTGYHELIGGAVSRISWGRQAVSVALAVASASDSKYLQIYLVPSCNVGRFELAGTIEGYEPLQRAGVRQLDVNPIGLIAHLSKRVGVGAFYALSLATGEPPRQRAGPALEIELPSAVLRIEGVFNLKGAASELRVAASMSL